jgi:hypothetical protein
VPHLADVLTAGAPLDPTRDEARRWARHELSDPVYAQHEPGWAERALLWLWHSLDNLSLPAGPGSTGGLVILLALVVLAVLVVWLRTGPMRGPTARARQQAVLQGTMRTAAEHRALADQAAEQGRWQEAVRERFRAVVRGLEERGLIDELPGRTAQEVATDAGRSLPAHRVLLREAAGVFDDVCYGSRAATSEHDAVVRRLDAQVAAATPVEGAPA